MCICESFKPGITVRPFRSIIFVLSPLYERLSSLLPTAIKILSFIATEDTNG